MSKLFLSGDTAEDAYVTGKIGGNCVTLTLI